MIEDVIALPIYNSRGEETIKVWIKNEKGFYSASAPTGKSRGKWEAKTLDVKKIMSIFPRIKKNLIGMKEEEFEEVDEFMEQMGGKKLEKIGANLTVAVSMACIRAASDNKVYRFLNPEARTFPYPLGVVLSGGAHQGYTSIQEFLVVPTKAKTIQEAIETNFKIWRNIGKVMKIHGYNVGRGDEGGWVSRRDDLKSLELLHTIAKKYGAKIGIDMAASQFYKRGKYIYNHLGKRYTPKEQLDFVEHIAKSFNLYYIEDPFHENDLLGFASATRKIGALICGDDLFATNSKKLTDGAKKNAANSIIIKPDQVGTISKTLITVETAKRLGYKTIVSHRSGETGDTFIADLAVATESPLIKCGIAGGERVSKLNRLIEIWNGIKKPKMAKLR